MEDKPDDRESSVGLELSVGVQLRRRRGHITDVWEARLTTVAIALVAGLVIGYALTQIFAFMQRLFSG